MNQILFQELTVDMEPSSVAEEAGKFKRAAVSHQNLSSNQSFTTVCVFLLNRVSNVRKGGNYM